jgi:hypothetical protein
MREEMAEDWADPNEAGDESDEVRVGRIVQHLLSLAGDEEARRLLGLDGTLEDNLDMMFVADPLAWIANDIAQAIRLEDDETDTVSLSSVVAALRLYQLLHDAPDRAELGEAVLDYLDDSEDEL